MTFEVLFTNGLSICQARVQPSEVSSVLSRRSTSEDRSTTPDKSPVGRETSQDKPVDTSLERKQLMQKLKEVEAQIARKQKQKAQKEGSGLDKKKRLKSDN